MRKKLFFLIPVILLLIALPLALLLIQRQQDTRSRASSTNDIVLSFLPSTTSVAPNTDINIDILMNTNNKPVNTVEFKVTFDKDLLALNSVTNGTSFDAVFPNQQPNNTTGTYFYAGTGKAHQDVSGSAIKIATLAFKTKTATSQNNKAELGFTELLAGAAGETEPVRHTTSFTAGEITVEQNTACEADNGRPVGCTCDSDEVCESGGCDAGKCVATNSQTCEDVTTDKPDGCSCTEDTQCASNVCGDDNKCELAPDATATPTTTPTRTPTPTTGIIPTATLFPTPTIGATDRRLNISVEIPGIGSAENNTPLHPQRKANIKLYDRDNRLSKEITAVLTYDPASSRYKGLVGFGTYQPASNPHLARLKISNSISKQSSNILLIATSAATPPFNESLVLGDVNNDNELSIVDYNLLVDCSRNNICQTTDEGQNSSDMNDDGKIDGKDLNLLYIGFASRRGE